MSTDEPLFCYKFQISRDLASIKLPARHLETLWGNGNGEQIKLTSLQRKVRTSDTHFKSLNHPFLMSLILHRITNGYKVFKNDKRVGENEPGWLLFAI